MQDAEHFRAESRALRALIEPIAEERYDEPTQFKAWTINDVLQHLHFWNDMARLQLDDEALLRARLDDLILGGGDLRAFERKHLGGLAGKALLETWGEGAERTADRFAAADPKARLIWAGPSMSARSSITARQMETWAHGQEVYDLLGVSRADTDRIKGIAVLGVKTFAWTYVARGEAPPSAMPQVILTAPSGAVWTFGEDASAGRVEGSATEFCQVVTQTRNVADTALNVSGPIAEDWMSKAQCFAGAPTNPPAAGARHKA